MTNKEITWKEQKGIKKAERKKKGTKCQITN